MYAGVQDFSRPLRDSYSFLTTTQDYVLGYLQTSLRDFADVECALRHWIDLGRLIESPVGGAKAVVGLRPSFSAHVRFGERGAPVDYR
jgi:hypothetical protein